MILVTVGGQLPFDRLIRCVDEWAGRSEGVEFLAQIGDGEYTPSHMRWERFVAPARFRELMSSAEGIVAHAGVGTILTALELQKPLLVFPRRAEHREHRSDHQLGTARYFGSHGHVLTAYTEAELRELLPRLREQRPGERPPPASPQLIARLRAYAFGARPPLPP